MNEFDCFETKDIKVDGQSSKAPKARVRQAAQASLQIVSERILSEIRIEKSL